MLYAFMYVQTEKVTENTKIEAGIYSFKNLNSGFLQLNFSEKARGKDYDVSIERIDEFMEKIKSLLQTIYNKEIPFTEPVELAF